MEDNSSLKLSFRFASDTGFRQLPLAVPCTVRDVREHLKATLNITSPLDVVVYSVVMDSNIEDCILSDDYNLFGGMRCLVKRVPESLVKVLLRSCQASSSMPLLVNNCVGPQNSNGKTGTEVDQLEQIKTPSVLKKSDAACRDGGNAETMTLSKEEKPSFCSSAETENRVSNNTFSSLSQQLKSPLKSISPTRYKCLTSDHGGLSSELTSSTVHVNSDQSYDTISSSCVSDIEDELAKSSKLPVESNHSFCTSNTSTTLNEDDEEDERERILLKKIAEENGSYRIPYTRNVSLQRSVQVANDVAISEESGPQNALAKSRELLGRRYFRNRKLSWIKKDLPFISVIPPSGSFTSTAGIGTRHHSHQSITNVSRHLRHQFPVCERYLCHICGEKGHHIRNCPKGSDPKQQKKVKPATGFPRSWLCRIPKEQVAVVDCDVYSLPDGTFAVLKDFSTTVHSSGLVEPLKKNIPQHHAVSSSSTVESYLHCTLCGHLFRKAVLTPCCGETFCESCILSHMNYESSKNKCPSCHAIINPNDLSSNKIIQDSVDVALGIIPMSSKRTQHNLLSKRCIIDSNKRTLVSTRNSVSPPLEKETKMVKLDEASGSNIGLDYSIDPHVNNLTKEAKLFNDPHIATNNPGCKTMGTGSAIALKDMSEPSIFGLAAQPRCSLPEVARDYGNTKSLAMSLQVQFRMPQRERRPQSGEDFTPCTLATT